MEELEKNTKECKYCFSEIDARASVCKYCLRNQCNWIMPLIKALLIICVIASIIYIK